MPEATSTMLTTAALASIALPVVIGAVAFSWKSNATRPWLLVGAAGAHVAASAWALSVPEGEDGQWLALDAPGRVVLGLISVLFAICSVYAVGYLRARAARPNRVFCASLLLFLGMMTFITWTNHLALMWVAVEATTLASAPLLYFNHNARSLEATWKYLMVGSVGIALALLGSLFLGYAATNTGPEPSLMFDELVGAARSSAGFAKPWLHAAFVLLVVGYGTKMGLAPMHTWKPDAYGEAPGLVGALLAGGMTSCAFLAVLRVYRVMAAAGEVAFAGRVLLILGLVSMAVAGVFMVRQRDFKRMLAYSSVEHMGILALGLGLGGAGIFGALLHMVNNGIVKGVMFMAAGNIHRAYGSKRTEEVSGALRVAPWSGALLLAGFIAVTGSPPFGPFVSEFTIVTAAFGQQRYLVGAGMLLFLLVIFMGMGTTVLSVVQGVPAEKGRAGVFRDTLLTILPPVLLLTGSLIMGLFMPTRVQALIAEAARFVGGGQ